MSAVSLDHVVLTSTGDTGTFPQFKLHPEGHKHFFPQSNRGSGPSCPEKFIYPNFQQHLLSPTYHPNSDSSHLSRSSKLFSRTYFLRYTGLQRQSAESYLFVLNVDDTLLRSIFGPERVGERLEHDARLDKVVKVDASAVVAIKLENHHVRELR